MQRFYGLLIIFVFTFLVAACSDKEVQEKVVADEQNDVTATEEPATEQVDDTNEEPKEVQDEDTLVGPPLPTTLEELEKLPSGYTEHISLLEEEGMQLTDELTKIYQISRIIQRMKN